MEKRTLNELERINNLMGNKKSIKEIRTFAKIGVTEAIAEIKIVMRESTEMVRRGVMSIDDFKSKLKEDIKVFEEYIPAEKYKKITQEIDDTANLMASQKRFSDLADQLDNQLDNLDNELAQVKKNFNIDLAKFKKELAERTLRYYKKALSAVELSNYVDEMVGNLDGINPNSGNRYVDDVIELPRNNTVQATDTWVDNFVETFVMRRKASIDADPKYSQSAKDTMKQKLDLTKEDIKNAMKRKIRQEPSYQEKHFPQETAKQKQTSLAIEHLEPDEAQLYNELKNKPESELTSGEKQYIKNCETIMNNPNNKKVVPDLRRKVMEFKNKYINLTEPWYKNNILMDFYTKFIEPKFRFVRQRLSKLIFGRTTFTKASKDKVLQKMYSSFDNFRVDKIVEMDFATTKRMLRELLAYSENVAELEIKNFDDLFNDLVEDLRNHIPKSEMANFDEWAKQVKNTKRSRTDIGFDELLPGSQNSVKESDDVIKDLSKDAKGVVTDIVFLDIKRIVKPKWWQFIKNKTLQNLFLEGKYRTPADYQLDIYKKAVENGFDGTLGDFTKTQASIGLMQHYAFKMVVIPPLVCAIYFLYEFIIEMGLQRQGKEAISSLDEYLALLTKWSLLGAPFLNLLGEEEQTWLDTFTGFFPGILDDTIYNVFDWSYNFYSESYANPEERIKAETGKDITNYWNQNKSEIINLDIKNTTDIYNTVSAPGMNSTPFMVKNNSPYFAKVGNPFIKDGKVDSGVAKNIRNLTYRIKKSPLTANPVVLLTVYKKRVLDRMKDEGSDESKLKKYKDDFLKFIQNPEEVIKQVEGMSEFKENSSPTLQPQLQINGKWYTLTLINDNIYYYPISYEYMISMLESGDFAKTEEAIKPLQINNLFTVKENKIIEMIKKLILEQDEDKTLKMDKWNGIFSFQKIDEKNPGKFLDVKIKMDEVMSRMPHWREKYSKLCEELENCDDDGEDDSFVRAVIDTHPDVVRILFTKGLAHLTSSEEQEELNEGLHRILSLIRESKNVEVEVWSVYRHPSSPDKIWSLVKGDYKPKELASMDVKMQQSPGNKVEKKKNSLDELKKKEYEAIKLLSTDEKKGITELPIKLRNKVKEKIKKGWTTEKPTSNLLKFHKEEDLDSVLSDPIKLYKLKPNKSFLEFIKSSKISENFGRGFCRAIHYVKKEIDMDTTENKKINEILKTCENKFDGKYGQNYI